MNISSNAFIAFVSLAALAPVANAQMVKMCLFYDDPSGHVRSDPIINQDCPADHVHTFYGPQNIHPNTSYNDLVNTSPSFSTSPVLENQSLYWHPTIYEVTIDANGVETYTRAEGLFSSPYYRWDNSVLPRTEAFPPEFRMIARTTDEGANAGGESEANMLVECCNFNANGGEECESWDFMTFPTRSCGFLGIAFAMPTCWNGGLGIDNGPGHSDHMAYTLNGRVDGECPEGFDRRLPQVQLFVRINNYKGGKYVLSDGSTDVFHVDFFNGWQDGVLKTIIDDCPIVGDGDPNNYNPPCTCDQFLTRNTQKAGVACDSEVQALMVDEPTDVVVGSLPRGTCSGPALRPKEWETNPPFTCFNDPTPGDESGDGEDEDDDGDDDEQEECADDPDFRFLNQDSKDCDWVRKRRRKRCSKMHEGAEVSEFCPVACRACGDDNDGETGESEEEECADDPDFRFLDQGSKDCGWVRKRRRKRCSKMHEGAEVSEFCPVACRACD